MPEKYFFPKIYGCVSRDNAIREHSSSGGIFSLIAEYFLRNGGHVFATSYDASFSAVTREIESIEDIANFAGSKYVQTKLGSTFIDIKRLLDKNEQVLFVGTPCQVAGLHSFLRQEYDSLWTIDFICHGVPSDKMWSTYRDLISNKKEIKSISFRNKAKGWRKFGLQITYSDNSIYYNDKDEEPYLKAFIDNLILRPSCYECHFKGLMRKADITLADFWGIELFDNNIDDDRGVSLVLVNNKKASQLFSEISGRIIFEEFDQSVLEQNILIYHSAVKHKKRDELFKNVNDKNLVQLLKKYTKVPLYKKIIRNVRMKLIRG